MVAGNDCETFWDKDQLTDSCYQFNFQSTLSWREAWASCEQQGADLLSITEIHEQTYINGEVARRGRGGWACRLGERHGGEQEPETRSPSLEHPKHFCGWGSEDIGGGHRVRGRRVGRYPSHRACPAFRAPHWLQLHTVDWP